MLQYYQYSIYANIIGYGKRYYWNCKKLTQVEVGYWLLNVAECVCGKVLLFLHVYMLDGSIMVNFI